MKKKLFLSGIFIFLMAILFLATGCKPDDDNEDVTGGGITGTWGGMVMGNNATVVITASGWTLSVPDVGLSYSGTYVMSGITATLYSGSPNIGTAVIIDSNTISVTLNQNSIAPGTYSFTRR
jgi:hypothetical protein